MNSPFCGRLGCGLPASTVLLISPQQREAWLVGLDHESAPEGVHLCETHADRITVPFGWGLHNERGAPKRKRKRAARPKKKAADVQPELGSTDDAPPSESVDQLATVDAVVALEEPEETPPEAIDTMDEVEAAEEVEEVAEVEEEALDEPTIQLPAIDVSIPAPVDPAPSDVPVNADHVAEAMAAADDPRHLQVVAADPASTGEPAPISDATSPGGADTNLETAETAESAPESEADVQPSLWDDADKHDTIPSDRTPLLKRAFRVVSDD